MNREDRLKYIELQYEGIKIADKCYNDNTYIEWKNNYNGMIPYSIISDYIRDNLNADKFDKYDRYEFTTIRKRFIDQLQHLIETNTNYQTRVGLDIPFCTILSITDSDNK